MLFLYILLFFHINLFNTFLFTFFSSLYSPYLLRKTNTKMDWIIMSVSITFMDHTTARVTQLSLKMTQSPTKKKKPCQNVGVTVGFEMIKNMNGRITRSSSMFLSRSWVTVLPEDVLLQNLFENPVKYRCVLVCAPVFSKSKVTHAVVTNFTHKKNNNTACGGDHLVLSAVKRGRGKVAGSFVAVRKFCGTES